jgi:hypothetical protein
MAAFGDRMGVKGFKKISETFTVADLFSLEELIIKMAVKISQKNKIHDRYNLWLLLYKNAESIIGTLWFIF